jgi:hypothetical protein
MRNRVPCAVKVRQGETSGRMRFVLASSIIGTVAAFVAIAVFNT